MGLAGARSQEVGLAGAGSQEVGLAGAGSQEAGLAGAGSHEVSLAWNETVVVCELALWVACCGTVDQHWCPSAASGEGGKRNMLDQGYIRDKSMQPRILVCITMIFSNDVVKCYAWAW